jgi:hypothetical protein
MVAWLANCSVSVFICLLLFFRVFTHLWDGGRLPFFSLALGYGMKGRLQ